MELYSAVFAYSDGTDGTDPTVFEEATYTPVGHNLLAIDARRLDERLQRQFSLDSHVINHRVYHNESKVSECDQCQLLIEEIIEKASIGRRVKEVKGTTK